MSTSVLSVRVPDEIKKRFDDLCSKNNLSPKDVFCHAMEKIKDEDLFISELTENNDELRSDNISLDPLLNESLNKILSAIEILSRRMDNIENCIQNGNHIENDIDSMITPEISKRFNEYKIKNGLSFADAFNIIFEHSSLLNTGNNSDGSSNELELDDYSLNSFDSMKKFFLNEDTPFKPRSHKHQIRQMDEIQKQVKLNETHIFWIQAMFIEWIRCESETEPRFEEFMTNARNRSTWFVQQMLR